MPHRSARSEQAKAQRASRKRQFGSAFIEDPFEKLLDPDYHRLDLDVRMYMCNAEYFNILTGFNIFHCLEGRWRMEPQLQIF